MSRVLSINEDSRPASCWTESDITQAINRRRCDSAVVCVKVRIVDEDVDIILATPACVGAGGGGRLPRPRERRLFELWRRLNLNTPEFSPGNVVAFLKQAETVLN